LQKPKLAAELTEIRKMLAALSQTVNRKRFKAAAGGAKS
jgi:hypothetical protein